MINYIHSIFHKVENGYDPISKSLAKKYSSDLDILTINAIEYYLGDLKGKHILDLCGGNGSYSLYFLKKKAILKYNDISRNYLEIAKEKVISNGFELDYELSYIDNFSGKYEIIFNNVSFYYCMNEKGFIRKLYSGLVEGGIYFGVLLNEKRFETNNVSFLTKFQFYLNEYFGIKIGHPFISEAKIKRLFEKSDFDIIVIKSLGENTLVVAQKV